MVSKTGIRICSCCSKSLKLWNLHVTCFLTHCSSNPP